MVLMYTYKYSVFFRFCQIFIYYPQLFVYFIFVLFNGKQTQ